MTKEQRQELQQTARDVRTTADAVITQMAGAQSFKRDLYARADAIDAALAEIDRLKAALVYAEAAFRDEGLTVPTRIIRKALEGRD